jgi:hypothetical protein
MITCEEDPLGCFGVAESDAEGFHGRHVDKVLSGLRGDGDWLGSGGRESLHADGVAHAPPVRSAWEGFVFHAFDAGCW